VLAQSQQATQAPQATGEPAPKPKAKSKVKQRRITPCGPGAGIDHCKTN
jgi:hypothetical protein